VAKDKPSYRTMVAGELVDNRDLSPDDELLGLVADAEADALERLSAEDEVERQLRKESFARMGHSPHVEMMKHRLNQELSDRAGRMMPGSVDRYPYLPRLGRLAQHGFANYVQTTDMPRGATQTINGILRDVPDDWIILACGHSTGWYTMPAGAFKVAVKRNQVRLTGQVLRGGSNPAHRTGDRVHCVYCGHTYGIAFRIMEP
jgi:hypothetical protein